MHGSPLFFCMHVDHQVFHHFLQSGGATLIFSNFYAFFGLFLRSSKMRSSVNQAQIMSSYGNQANSSDGPYKGLGQVQRWMTLTHYFKVTGDRNAKIMLMK